MSLLPIFSEPPVPISPILLPSAPSVDSYHQYILPYTIDLKNALTKKYWMKNESMLDWDLHKYLTFDQKLEEF
jgi:hypothetical protein